jgi:GDP-4-dehydro-6-deoxy-D-mannose reductase
VNDNRPVLVTGAAGFAGRHLLERLGSTGDIVGWSRAPVSPELGRLARWQHVDVARRDDVRAALREIQPGRVYHLAGVSNVDRSRSHPAEALAINVAGTHYLLDGLRRLNRGARVIVAGSAMVYAPSSAPSTELSPTAPESPYGFSKFAQERLALRVATDDGLDVVIARAFNHTGPGQAPTFVAPSIAHQIALIERGRQEPVLRVGNLDSRRDLTDVRDVVRAYTDLMARGLSGEIYNVASGVGRPIRTLLDTLVGAASVPIRVEVDPERVRAVEKSALVGDATKLRALTGWTPTIAFDRMLVDLLEYWRANS